MTSSPVVLLFIFSLISLCTADTEIVNFRSGLHFDVENIAHLDWDKLSYQNNTQILEIHPSRLSENDFRHLSEEEGTCHGRICSGDQWIVIDVDDWFKSGAEKETERMFTLRISWPASTPAEFRISLHEFLPSAFREPPPKPPKARGTIFNIDEERAIQSNKHIRTRRLFARIRCSTSKFLRAPNPDRLVVSLPFNFLSRWFSPPCDRCSHTSEGKKLKSCGVCSGLLDDERVRFHIVLEPLAFGFLPESLIPGLGFMAILLFLTGVFIVPRVNAAFAQMAQRARKGKGKAE